MPVIFGEATFLQPKRKIVIPRSLLSPDNRGVRHRQQYLSRTSAHALNRLCLESQARNAA